jgi:hypothetical protein
MMFGKKSPSTKRYGRLHDDPSVPRIELHPHGGAVLTPPASADWSSAVPEASWGMLANGPDNSVFAGYEGAGDCTCAAAGHVEVMTAFFAESGTDAPVTSDEVLALYEIVSPGYNPQTGANDNGATVQGALQAWQQHGLAGMSPTAFAQLDITNTALLQTAIALFGCIVTGFDVVQAFETAFDSNVPFDVSATRAGSRVLGGHCVPFTGYNTATGMWTCVTWGSTFQVTNAAFVKYWQQSRDAEAWIVVVPELMEAAGLTPSGLNTAQANADWQTLTNTTASPFPVVTPPVTPPPVTPPTPPVPPTPGTGPSAADIALNTAIVAWQLAVGIDSGGHVAGH